MKDTLRAAVIAVLLVVLSFLGYGELQDLGSAVTGQEYVATTTGASDGNASTYRVLKSTPGAVGQITIVGSTVGRITLYNATTTNSADHAPNSTSTITVIEFAPSAAVGTYVLDATFDQGILLETFGTEPTSTILYR